MMMWSDKKVVRIKKARELKRQKHEKYYLMHTNHRIKQTGATTFGKNSVEVLKDLSNTMKCVSVQDFKAYFNI
jgi:hypothetical protein